jgi:hypothetical protein
MYLRSLLPLYIPPQTPDAIKTPPAVRICTHSPLPPPTRVSRRADDHRVGVQLYQLAGEVRAGDVCQSYVASNEVAEGVLNHGLDFYRVCLPIVQNFFMKAVLGGLQS